MAARMWTHGVSSFLKILRHRMPESTNHLIAFFCNAYHTMTLFYETITDFGETWIECLGDLARYQILTNGEGDDNIPHI